VRIFALNCGSSSIKCAVVDSESGERAFELHLRDTGGSTDTAFAQLRDRWTDFGRVDAVVHRVVHGGTRFTAPTIIDDEVLAQLAALERLAPLHNAPAIVAIRLARELFPNVRHVAVFDTAFHTTLPPRAREYALPSDLRARFGIRRFGFHGISHGDLAARVATHLRRRPEELRIVSCHLGSGASLAAIEYGRSVETSMGMTPLEGLVMGTRGGDLDPGILLDLSRELSREDLESLLNKRAGLRGLTGTDDLREIERRAGDGDEDCRLAIGLHAHRIRKYLGAYAAVMGGVDVIAFTGGVGENSAPVRHRSLQRLAFLGALLDEERNRNARVDARTPIVEISREDSHVRILVVRADEEAAMAAAAAKLLDSPSRPVGNTRIPVAVSARHAHLSQPTLDQLFGPGYSLRPKSSLSQTGQFSAEETVRVIGPRGELAHVRLMGPPRAHDQVEISRSDEFILGIDAPVRISGDIANTPGATLEGPIGRVTLSHGVICARRHIHMNPVDAARLGIADRDTVSVRIDSADRDLTFNDVSVRVSPAFTLELHLDTDEANAAGIAEGSTAELLGP
jgi:acetate kinase